MRFQKGRSNVVTDSRSRAISEEMALGSVAVCQAKYVNGDLQINLNLIEVKKVIKR